MERTSYSWKELASWTRFRSRMYWTKLEVFGYELPVISNIADKVLRKFTDGESEYTWEILTYAPKGFLINYLIVCTLHIAYILFMYVRWRT